MISSWEVTEAFVQTLEEWKKVLSKDKWLTPICIVFPLCRPLLVPLVLLDFSWSSLVAWNGFHSPLLHIVQDSTTDSGPKKSTV
jgi:ABC-type glycerol-3-phosphate transport system permease component